MHCHRNSSDGDYALYRDLLAEHAAAAGVEIWAWVLMVSQAPDDLRRVLAAVHRRYAGHVHARLTIGRPIGNAAFLDRLERDSGRPLGPGKRGPRTRELNALSP